VTEKDMIVDNDTLSINLIYANAFIRSEKEGHFITEIPLFCDPLGAMLQNSYAFELIE
jgi:hypothetical protein